MLRWRRGDWVPGPTPVPSVGQGEKDVGDNDGRRQVRDVQGVVLVLVPHRTPSKTGLGFYRKVIEGGFSEVYLSSFFVLFDFI